MIPILLALVGMIYLAVSLSYYLDGNSGMSLAFAAYAISNLGIYLGAK